VAGVLIGLFGAVALAGNQIALSVGSTLYMLPLGVAGAVTIRIAQVIGAGEWPRVAAIGQAGLLVVTGWMGGFALLFLFAGAWIGGLFVDDPAVIAAAAAIFFVFGFTQLMDGVQSVSLGALRGMLDNDFPTRVSLVAYWLIALPLSALFGFGFDLGAPGVWAGFGVGLALAAVALVWRFLRLSRAKVPPATIDAAG
jgi:MATE family multidrug resistance protein